MASGYLMPKASPVGSIRKQREGQFVNPPVYMTWGGFSEQSKIQRDSGAARANMALEKGPRAKSGKPI